LWRRNRIQESEQLAFPAIRFPVAAVERKRVPLPSAHSLDRLRVFSQFLSDVRDVQNPIAGRVYIQRVNGLRVFDVDLQMAVGQWKAAISTRRNE
jgi:hypothetical protein